MKTAVALAAMSALVSSTVSSCSITSGVKVTFYGFPDNSPPGAATAYNCGGRNYKAGGSGTYGNPLTFASHKGEYSQCEIIYLPYLKKYLRLEDDCVQCDTDYNNGIKHIDIWTGSSTSNGGQNQINCEDALTPDAKQGVIRAPPSNLPVDTTSLYSGGQCKTGNTYKDNSASCSSGGGGGSGGCQTGCSWAGHCIGCSCQTFDDCSDNYVCKSGKCAAP